MNGDIINRVIARMNWFSDAERELEKRKLKERTAYFSLNHSLDEKKQLFLSLVTTN